MIIKCKCGALYNNQTVEHCPLCTPVQDQNSFSEIDSFLSEQRREVSKQVRSFKASSMSIWQSQHLQDRKDFHET